MSHVLPGTAYISAPVSAKMPNVTLVPSGPVATGTVPRESYVSVSLAERTSNHGTCSGVLPPSPVNVTSPS